MNPVKSKSSGVTAKKSTMPSKSTMERLSLGITPPKRDDRLESFDYVDSDPGPSHAQIHSDAKLREQAGMTALGMMPVVGDVVLAGRIAKNIADGNYKDAVIDAAVRKLKLPGVAPVKSAVKMGIKRELKG